MTITFDEFKKVELKTGKILSAESVEGSEKLIKLMVDIGGIALDKLSLEFEDGMSLKY